MALTIEYLPKPIVKLPLGKYVGLIHRKNACIHEIH